MEIYQLKYFIEVARRENMNQVTRDLGISTPALSRAIFQLEEEIGVQLFHRSGKKIKITSAGQAFLDRAIAIMDMVKVAPLGLGAKSIDLDVSIAGREILLSRAGLPLVEFLKKQFGQVCVKFNSCGGEEALRLAANGLCDFALTTQQPPPSFASCVVDEFDLVTCIGEHHPLFSAVKKGRALSIQEVLSHPFVAPNVPLFGTMESLQSYDGWRDDVYPRKISYVVQDIQLIRDIVASGSAMVYLPKFLCESAGFIQVKTHDCKFKCKCKIYLSTNKHNKLKWIENTMSTFKNL